MSGFGKNLTKETIKTKLFRKVSFDNYTDIRELCFSTEKSISLIGQGDFAIVLESQEYTGCYDEKDADAGKNYGYDEFRVEISNYHQIENIIVPDWWIEAINDENFEGADDPEKDPYIWVENIMKNYNIYMEVISASKAKEIYGIDFNF